jgi:hypothetical protein
VPAVDTTFGETAGRPRIAPRSCVCGDVLYRLQFVQKELNYEVSRDEALARLRLTYAHILDGEEQRATAPNDRDAEDEEDSRLGGMIPPGSVQDQVRHRGVIS